MNAHQVLEALKNDLIRDEYFPGGLFYAELEAPSANRRIDALWVEKFSGRVLGYEIKVSRQDLIHELRQPDKCDPWKRFCDQWWLVVGDPSLIVGLEDQIPEEWGICTPPTASNRRMMKVLRPAPKLVPADKAPLLGKLAGVAGRDIAQANMDKRNAEFREERQVTEIRTLRAELRRAGATEHSANEAELVRRALLVANGLLQAQSPIFDPYAARHSMDLESQKLGTFLAHAFLAQETDKDILASAKSRADAVDRVMKEIFTPIREHWRTGHFLKQIDELIAKRPGPETLFEVES